MKKHKILIFLLLCICLFVGCSQFTKKDPNSSVDVSDYENNENFNLDFKFENE